MRGYYDRLILHLVEGLDIEGYQAHNFEGLLKLQRTYELTHVFMAQEEYEENREYYEKLADTLKVVVIAEREYSLSQDSKLLAIHKPFSALSVVNLLNGEVEEARFEEAQAAGRKPFSCVGVNALAVDDEEMNLVVAKGVLGSYGIQVETCLSGKEAVERCRNTSYDIVFLDHMMPGFDGVETLKRIREINGGMYQDLPVIALTANTISGAREMFRNEGFTEFIPKPIERAVLERVLRKVLPKDHIQYGTESAGRKNAAAESDVPKEAAPGAGSDKPKETVPETGSDMPKEAQTYDPASPYGQLEQAGINVEMGLAFCCGEDEFYEEMLRMFSSQCAEKKDEIISLYEASNWADYAVKVHALKSTSLTIGAEELSARAKELEMAGKSEDIEFIRENHPALMLMYEEVCVSIAALYNIILPGGSIT